MTPAITSLIALGAAILLSCISRINVGILAIALAWIIGVYQAGWKPDAVIGGFPVSLFLMLAGVTLLFAMAETNGTLQRLTHRVVRLTGGSPRLLPIAFFVLGLALSSAGPGGISAVALLAPLAMPVAATAGVSPLLMALMVALGSNAGNLSPVSAVGVIANTKMAEAGIGGHDMKVWFTNLVAHALVAAIAYLFLRPKTTDHRPQTTGHRPQTTDHRPQTTDHRPQTGSGEGVDGPALTSQQRLTVAVIAAWIVGVIVFKVNVGLAAFAAASLLAIARAGDEAAAVKAMPWGVIVMVSGITVLIGVLEKSGGMDLFATLLAKLATPETINGSIAFITGLISTWSSTSGVVLPTFLPTVPALVAKVGGGDPLAVALSINVGSALVDVSPLSTIGALCIAAVSDQTASRTLFRQLMIFGLTMAVVGALLMQLLAGAIASA